MAYGEHIIIESLLVLKFLHDRPAHGKNKGPTCCDPSASFDKDSIQVNSFCEVHCPCFAHDVLNLWFCLKSKA